MHVKIKQLYGCVLSASDGVIGHVKDIYFDDQKWVVRYLVADTGTWLSERLVLLSPNAFGKFQQKNSLLEINLSMKQIETSPRIDTQKPISKQFEEEYFRHYGWPYYWQPDGALNGGGYPMEMPPQPVIPGQPLHAVLHPENLSLRSAQTVAGYRVQASDGTIGHVADFVLDTNIWAIQKLLVKPSTWFSTTHIEISVNDVQRINFDESTVYVNVTKASLEDIGKSRPSQTEAEPSVNR